MLIRLADKFVIRVRMGRSAAVQEASAAAGANVLRLVCPSSVAELRRVDDTAALRRLSTNRISMV